MLTVDIVCPTGGRSGGKGLSCVESWITLLKLEEQVQLLGWKEHPWEECLDTGIMVMASEYEGFALSAIEASSLGMTVVSTPVSGITDYIIPGLNGYTRI